MKGEYRELEERRAPRTRHTLSVDNRERVSLTGVNDVASFNEQEVLLSTDIGDLAICGEELHISKLNLEDGQLIIEGVIYALEYIPDQPSAKGGFLSKLFR